jgi:hypothetical protein
LAVALGVSPALMSTHLIWLEAASVAELCVMPARSVKAAPKVATVGGPGM